MDSKQVSIASSATGVTPMLYLKRYSAKDHSKKSIPFPNAFHVYNRFMGGVDLHDSHCNNVHTFIRSKKWTHVVFIRLIQAAVTNALVIHNLSNDESEKIGTKEIAMSVARHYLDIGQKRYKKNMSFVATRVKKSVPRRNVLFAHTYTAALVICIFVKIVETNFMQTLNKK